MQRIGKLWIAAALIVAAPAGAQQSEMENYQAGGDALLANHRETTQFSIDRATQALQARDYKTARRFAVSVTRSDPKRIEAWRLLGAAQVGLQDWSGARMSYTRAVRITPGDLESRAGLGVALARTNDPKAQEQLTWFTAKAQACTSGCAPLIRFKAEIETALAETAKGS